MNNNKKKYNHFNTKKSVAIVCAIIVCLVAAYAYKLISDYSFVMKSNRIADQIGEENAITGIWHTDHPYKLKIIVQQNEDSIHTKIYAQLSGGIPFAPQHIIDAILHDRKANFEINKGFSIEKWEISFEDGKLHATILQHFTDNSGRQDNAMKFVLERKRNIL